MWLLTFVYAIWEFFAPYPIRRIEQIGKPEDSDDEDKQEYDYIIVGGYSHIVADCRRNSRLCLGKPS